MLKNAKHRSLTPYLVILLSLLFCDIALSQPRERDVWDSIGDDSKRYGYVHTIVKKLPDGNFRYNQESRILISCLGTKHEITSRAEYVVTREYHLIYAKITGMRDSGPIRVECKISKGKLLLSSVAAGVEQNRTMDLPEGVIFSVCLDDWLREQPQDTQTIHVNVLEEQTFQINRCSLTCDQRDGSGSKWRFRMGAHCRGHRSYDAKGGLREAVYEIPKMRMRRTPAEQARDIEYGELGGRDILAVPVDKKITAPERLTRLSVNLRWKDLPFNELDLEDSRQRVVTKSHQDGNYQAMMKIQAVDLTGCDVAFPLPGGGHEPYLAETMFIKPHHKSIVAAARKIVQGKNTALAAVKALSGFVYKHVEPALILENLTGPEVLESRIGKCAEFAVLFASLARSVGIPTRIVLGDRMVGDVWMGHGWNEVFVGRWITVDANFNEVGTSFALLKFKHSPSVLGTQTIRWTLGDSLSIAIKDFDLKPSPLAGKYASGIEGHIFTSVDFACRVTAPGEDWVLTDTSQPGNVAVNFKPPGNADYDTHLVGIPVPMGTTPKAVVASRLAQIRGAIPDAQLEEEKPFHVNGAIGLRRRYRGAITMNNEKRVVRLTEVHVVHGSRCFIFQMTSPEAAHERRMKDFRELISGFERLDADTGF